MRTTTSSPTLSSHSDDAMTLLAHSADELLSLYENFPAFHAVLWRRTQQRAQYLDIFNNASGVRSCLEEIQPPEIEAGTNIIVATFEDGITGPISYRFGDDHPESNIRTQKFLNILKDLPFLRRDIELGIRHVWNRYTPNIAVQILNEYPHDDYRRPVLSEASQYHVDMGRTAYIQIGGAGMECVNVDLSNKCPQIPLREQAQMDYITPDTVYFVENDLPVPSLRHVWSLESADLLLFRGLSEESAMAHRSPCDQKTMKTGRLAITMYPTA